MGATMTNLIQLAVGMLDLDTGQKWAQEEEGTTGRVEGFGAEDENVQCIEFTFVRSPRTM